MKSESSTLVRAWMAVSFGLGAGLTWSGWRLRTADFLPSYDRPAATIAMAEGFALMILVLVAGLGISRIPLSEDRPFALARRPYLGIFVVSLSALFLEVMLIRYASSQIRVFSFYKNVPLVGSFLGLGLGCWQGRGRPRHVFFMLLWLIPLSAFLSASPVVAGRLLGRSAAAVSAEQILGDFVPTDLSLWQQLESQLVMTSLCVLTLAAVTLLFAPMGRLLGDALAGAPRLPAYTLNIVGSLAGILLFVALSRLETPPWVWFAVGLLPLVMLTARSGLAPVCGALAVFSILLVCPSHGETIWSPYQKLVGHSVPPPGGQASDPPAYLVQISDVFYQVAVDLRPEAYARTGANPLPHYDALYQGLPKPERVLIVGAGTGNDVAAALRAGAGQVDAVDIDPAIVEMGRRHHPERPYQDPRVTVIVDDARAAFRKLPRASYDLVVFGLLDSHTQLGVSSVRLDNYVFTLQSFSAARDLVRPGGHMAVTAASFQPWFRARMAAMMKRTVGTEVQLKRYGFWWTFLGEVPRVTPAATAADPSPGPLPTDDWPFLYLPERRVPLAYALTVLAMAATSVLVLRAHGMRASGLRGYNGHLLFLGAAFLLMEVHAINRLAVLFGTTWLVSAVTIALVLVLIVLANFVTLLGPGIPYAVSYAALGASLLASYLIEPSRALGGGGGLTLLYGLALLSPVFFAGLVFARSFPRTADAGSALGANILGSVLGGCAEYASMGLGIRALVLIAMGFYGLSLAALAHRASDAEGAGAPVAASPHGS